MKIGFDAKRAFYNNTGLGNYSRTVIRQLSSIFPEHQYFLFTPRFKNKFESFPPDSATVIEPDKPIDQLFRSFWRSVNLGKELSRYEIEIFHGLSNELPLNINKKKIKSVVTIHDLIFLRYPHLYNKTDRIIYKKKVISATKLADKIIAISEQTQNDLISFFDIDPEKIEIIYQGCNPVFYNVVDENAKKNVRSTYNLPDNFILYVGTIEERKNLLQLIIARHENGIELPMVVLGRPTYPYFDKILRYIDTENVRNIIFIQNVSQTDLPAIYQMSSVFVYPSSFEGFGIPVLEALNSGVPVIAAKGSCLEETGGKHSLYIDPLHPEEIANALSEVLSNENLKKTMIEEGHNHAMNFRDDRTTGKLMELYKNL